MNIQYIFYSNTCGIVLFKADRAITVLSGDSAWSPAESKQITTLYYKYNTYIILLLTIVKTII